MKLYEILIPHHPNDGGVYPEGTYPAFCGRIGKAAGGYTLASSVDGYWRDPATGKEYHEPMLVVRVACEPETMAAIIADALATFADQKCIMSYVASEAVTFTSRPVLTADRAPSNEAAANGFGGDWKPVGRE